MKRVLPLLAVASACALAGPAFAANGGTSSTTTWKAVASGALEVPPNASPGSSIVTIDVGNQELFVDVPFRDLLGTTTGAHIHCCTSTAFTGSAPIAVPFTDFPTGVQAGTYNKAIPLSEDMSYDPAFLADHGGTAQAASSALMDAIAANEAYVNIHTSTYPNGEVRGWLVAAPVPEPGSWAMLGGGLAALAALKRRRRTG